MILDEDLSEFEKMGKLCYLPVVQNPDENWNQAKGRITREMIEHFMPMEYADGEPDSIIMVCGPPALKDAIKSITDEMGLKNMYFYN
jgi:NAD(P)H-flavin reductase